MRGSACRGGYLCPMPEPGRPTILLVEDERSIAEPFASALEREGFEAVVAPTARAALELFRRRDPSLVLLDIALPGRRRPRGLPRAAARVGRADHHAHRARDGDRPRRRPRAGRRRLRGQAVQRGRGDRAHPRRPAPQRPRHDRGAPAGDRDRRPAARPRRAQRGARRRAARPLAQGVRPARAADARRGPRRHARGPDVRRLGRELVRLDQDARRARRLPAGASSATTRRRRASSTRCAASASASREKPRLEPAGAPADRARLPRRPRDRRVRGAARAQPARPRGERGAGGRANPGRTCSPPASAG